MNNILITTKSMIAKLHDPHNNAIIVADQVLPSKVGPGAGEGVFAGTALAKATTVCLYSGLTMTRVSLSAQR